MDGDADGPGLVGQPTLDRLADPPGRVRRELEASLVLELVDRTHEPGVALLDQVQQRHAAVHVLLGVRYDQPKVCRCQVLAGSTPERDQHPFALALVAHRRQELLLTTRLDPALKRRERDLVARPVVHRPQGLDLADLGLGAPEREADPVQ